MFRSSNSAVHVLNFVMLTLVIRSLLFYMAAKDLRTMTTKSPRVILSDIIRLKVSVLGVILTYY